MNEKLRTVSMPQTKSSGSPYLNTVSTNILSTSTCTQAITVSLQPVRAIRSVSPHNFLSSAATLSTSFSSSSFPPSLYLKSRGTHFLSRHLCTNSRLCFLKVVTAYKLNSSSWEMKVAERGTTMGLSVSYARVNSLVDELGTAMRWVSRYSESWMMSCGGTTETRDLVARLPVCLRVKVWRVVLRLLYWLYLARTSLSLELASWVLR